MYSTTEEPDEGYESPVDAKIMVGAMCGATFVLATITIAICCSCGWRRRKPRRKPVKAPQQQVQQAYTVPMGQGGQGGHTIIVVGDGGRQPGSLPGYNQQRQPVQQHPGGTHPGSHPSGTHPGSYPSGTHPGSHPGGPHPGGPHPGSHTGPRPGPQPGHVARAQNPGSPQGLSPPQNTQPQASPNAKKKKKDKKEKKGKEKENNNKTKEFRMSGLENKPSVEANSYIRMEVPAPSGELDKTVAETTIDPKLGKMIELMTKSIAKTLAAINIEQERIVRQDVLGSGQFGVVYKGELSSPDATKKTPVALKTVAGDANQEGDLQEFMDEVLRMKNFNHPNVMPMLGITIMDQKPHMVLPYMEKGDLRSFLSKPTEVFTVEDLMRLALQVSRGMEYLTGQNIIHGDLAARNCMVSKDDSVKVADFGLSRHLFQSDYYSLHDSETLRPYRWMAVECISHKKFTTKSDVWSFGILMWEIMTRGKRPYPEIKTNQDVGVALEKGYRMSCPQYCAEEIFDVMSKCWDADPANRPNFKHTTKMIELLLEQAGGDYEKPVSSPDTRL